MIGLVTQQRPDGSWPEAGGTHRWFTPEYRTLGGLLRRQMALRPRVALRVEVFASRETIYGDPISTVYLT